MFKSWITGTQNILWSLILIFIFFVTFSAGKKKTPTEKNTNEKETNVFNFLRLIVFRMIYGFAAMFGVQEGISDFMGGILVPPGTEDGDYRDYLDEDYLDY